MNGLALLGMIVIYLLICTAFGFIRGVAKSRIRCATVIASAVVAFVVTMIMKNNLMDVQLLTSLLESIGASGETVQSIETLLATDVVAETAVGMASALVMPLLFVILFVGICFLTWIVHLIATLILRRRLRLANERVRHKLLQTILLNLVQGLVVVFVLLVPINVYSQVSLTVIKSADEAEMLDDMPDVSAMVDDYIAPIEDSFVLRAFRTLGGEPISYALADFDANGTTAHLCDEVEVFADAICNTVAYVGEYSDATDERADDLLKLYADSMERSDLFSAVIGEVLYEVTDAWNDGEDYVGIAKPKSGELFDTLVNDLIRILHDDAQSANALRADLYTLTDVIVILDTHEVLESLSNDAVLTDMVGSNGVVKALTAKLEENASMKVLVPTIERIGMRAIATSLDLDGAGRAEHDELLSDIAESLNSTAHMSRDARIEMVNEELTVAFADAGVAIDREVLVSYSTDFVDEFENRENVSADDISEYLLTYTLNDRAG